MVWAALFITAAFYCSCITAQITLSQPASESVSPGGTATLPCTPTGINIGGYWVVWYQQKEGERPRYLLSYYDDNNKYQGDGVPDRFTGSKDTSKNTGYLTIKGVQREDEAMYYCAVWHSDQWIFGPGTPLSVLTGEAKAPLLSIYAPSEEELKTDKSSTVCIGMDFTPGSASIQWAVDGTPQTTGVSPFAISKQSNDLYSGSSILSLSATDYKKYSQISCTITHQGKSFVQTLKTSECN